VQFGQASCLLLQEKSAMPISTASFGDERDQKYNEYERADLYDQESMTFPGLTPELAETLLKRLGGGVAEKHQVVEGLGWKAAIAASSDGVTVTFDAHDELLEDLLRRFEELAERALR
jgi:predicted PolB exonuclease-like 3'-5' exonuclease